MKDVIVGKIYFLLVRIKIKHMELQIIKRETTGSGTVQIMQINIRENHKKFVCSDGANVRTTERSVEKSFFGSTKQICREKFTGPTELNNFSNWLKDTFR